MRDADPLDLPILLEFIGDTLGTETPAGKAAQSTVEHGLRARSPEYAVVAEVAVKARAARHIVAAKVSDATEAVSDLASRPVLGSLADKSVAVTGDAVADLEG